MTSPSELDRSEKNFDLPKKTLADICNHFFADTERFILLPIDEKFKVFDELKSAVINSDITKSGDELSALKFESRLGQLVTACGRDLVEQHKILELQSLFEKRDEIIALYTQKKRDAGKLAVPRVGGESLTESLLSNDTPAQPQPRSEKVQSLRIGEIARTGPSGALELPKHLSRGEYPLASASLEAQVRIENGRIQDVTADDNSMGFFSVVMFCQDNLGKRLVIKMNTPSLGESRVTHDGVSTEATFLRHVQKLCADHDLQLITPAFYYLPKSNGPSYSLEVKNKSELFYNIYYSPEVFGSGNYDKNSGMFTFPEALILEYFPYLGSKAREKGPDINTQEGLQKLVSEFYQLLRTQSYIQTELALINVDLSFNDLARDEEGNLRLLDWNALKQLNTENLTQAITNFTKAILLYFNPDFSYKGYLSVKEELLAVHKKFSSLGLFDTHEGKVVFNFMAFSRFQYAHKSIELEDIVKTRDPVEFIDKLGQISIPQQSEELDVPFAYTQPQPVIEESNREITTSVPIEMQVEEQAEEKPISSKAEYYAYYAQQIGYAETLSDIGQLASIKLTSESGQDPVMLKREYGSEFSPPFGSMAQIMEASQLGERLSPLRIKEALLVNYSDTSETDLRVDNVKLWQPSEIVLVKNGKKIKSVQSITEIQYLYTDNGAQMTEPYQSGNTLVYPIEWQSGRSLHTTTLINVEPKRAV